MYVYFVVLVMDIKPVSPAAQPYYQPILIKVIKARPCTTGTGTNLNYLAKKSST